MTNLAKFLKEYRANNNLTMSGLARKLHVSPSTVAKWEYGTRFPEIRETIILCRRLDVDVMKVIELIVEDLKQRV